MRFSHGDRVYVLDEGLSALRGALPAPHVGVVEATLDDDVLISFNQGGCVPYPENTVRPLMQAVRS